MMEFAFIHRRHRLPMIVGDAPEGCYFLYGYTEESARYSKKIVSYVWFFKAKT